LPESLSERSIRTFLPALGRAAGLIVAAIAAVELLGWLLHLQPLLRFLAKPTAMNPATALGLLLLGIGLHLASKRSSTRFPAEWWMHLFPLVPFCIASLKMAEYALGWELELDQLLFSTQLQAFTPPNEISPNTALALFLASAALPLIDLETHGGFRPGQVLMLGCGTLALIALIGYAYQVSSLYRVGTGIPMALSTAACFWFLTLGFMAVRPNRGFMLVVTSPTTGGAIARRLIPMAILIPWALGAVLLAGEQSGYYERQFGVAIFAVLSIVIFTLLTWWNAKLLYLADLERVRTERRLAAQHNATRLLTDSMPPSDLIPRLLAVIGQTLGWQAGSLWLPSPLGDKLECAYTWHAGDCEEFTQLTRTLTMTPNQGLPGRVWTSRRVAWIPELSQDANFPRLEAAVRASFRAAVAFPIPLGGESLGVMEFFSRRPEPKDEQLMEMLAGLGTHIGDSLERRRAEERLRKTSEDLRRSNTDLQQFAYVASHDLFEPLRMVISYLQLLSRKYEGKLDAEADEFIHFAVDGARRMEALIHDLLAYSRLDSSPRPFEPADSEEVLAAVLANLKVAIEEHGAVINHEPLPTVFADRIQLAQVFQNLIGNAIKFHKEGTPRVDIAARRSNGEWVFSFKDNGIGINPKDFERIFVIFQRLHTRQEYAGTGIGLAVCKRILERHGGRMWVESSPGCGSTFYFTLPAERGVR
jgi:signal transduction histidine kinase